eukprot:Unigene4466_Nuclearia_a/m.13645 Unigene4466_Nuclearia_a/g.13645  ORF Unigene4466_Nuclearia_a/g.13645 Unigene4466_Nuclearia_a/m.13645 type:complete len:823 (-) Unigene4466_Nuclearia_a:88-2556(-)
MTDPATADVEALKAFGEHHQPHRVAATKLRDEGLLQRTQRLATTVINMMPATRQLLAPSNQTELLRPRVMYAGFQHADVRVVTGNAAAGGARTQRRTLCLLLGYEDGYQVWDASDMDNVTEIVSLRIPQRRVHFVRVLQHPQGITADKELSRPHLAYLSDARAYVHSLRAPKLVTTIDLSKQCSLLTNLDSNGHIVVVGWKSGIAVYDAVNYKLVHNFSCVKPDPHTGAAVMSLGARWLAFATTEPLKAVGEMPRHDDAEADSSENGNEASMGATLYNKAWEYSAMLGERVAKQVVKVMSTPAAHAAPPPPESSDHGTVWIVDFTVGAAQEPVRAHPKVVMFQASKQSLSRVQFNPSGTLLATATHNGNDVDVFAVAPSTTQNGTARHLYQLRCGTSDRLITDISFSHGSRYVAATSANGTTHVFAINPMGGPATIDTHTARALTVAPRPPAERFKEPLVLDATLRVKQTPPPAADMVAAPSTPPMSSAAAQHLTHTMAFAGFEMERSLFAPTPRADASSSGGDLAGAPSEQLFQGLLTFSPTGMLQYHELCAAVYKDADAKKPPSLSATYENVLEWHVDRMMDWNPVFTACDVLWPAIANRRVPDRNRAARWKDNIEIQTHAMPEPPIWRGPQFSFHTFDTQSTTDAVIDAVDEDSDDKRPPGRAPTRTVHVPNQPPQPRTATGPADVDGAVLPVTLDGMQTRLASSRPLFGESDINFDEGAEMPQSNMKSHAEPHDADEFYSDAQTSHISVGMAVSMSGQDVSPIDSPSMFARPDPPAYSEADEDGQLVEMHDAHDAPAVYVSPDGDNELDAPGMSVYRG